MERLHLMLAAVAPIVGVSVGNVDDRATWRIDFEPQATCWSIVRPLSVAGSDARLRRPLT